MWMRKLCLEIALICKRILITLTLIFAFVFCVYLLGPPDPVTRFGQYLFSPSEATVRAALPKRIKISEVQEFISFPDCFSAVYSLREPVVLTGALDLDEFVIDGRQLTNVGREYRDLFDDRSVRVLYLTNISFNSVDRIVKGRSLRTADAFGAAYGVCWRRDEFGGGREPYLKWLDDEEATLMFFRAPNDSLMFAILRSNEILFFGKS